MKRTYPQDTALCGGDDLRFLMEKANLWVDTLDRRDEDELMRAMGYTVKHTDMAGVADKITQLETMMRYSITDAPPPREDMELGLISHLESETDHQNPTNMSNWVESLLSEVDVQNLDYSIRQPQFGNSGSDFFLPPPPLAEESADFASGSCSASALIYEEPTSSSYDLSAIPGEAICGERDRKRIKQEEPLPAPVPAGAIMPVMIDRSEDNGIRLVHSLMACAQAVQDNELTLAESLVKQISFLAASQAGAMGKVATYFAEALARRIFRFSPPPPLDSSFSDILQIHFYETCPHLRFAHFTANQAILESVAESTHVHIVDFSMKQGIQWPALMQALALRPGGPPTFRLTGIGPPQPDKTDTLQQVGWRLAQFADELRIKFEYKGFVANSLADLEAPMLDLRPGETVVVNSIFELHQLLARPGGIEKVLRTVRKMKPKIVTIVEQHANHNRPVFMDRFTESLHYYSTVFDSLEGYAAAHAESLNGQDLVMSEMYFGRQICNIVACEGEDRVERHESLEEWTDRLGSAGFVKSPLGSRTYGQLTSFLATFGGGDSGDGGYKLDERDGCMLLQWHARQLVASSAWRIGSGADSE